MIDYAMYFAAAVAVCFTAGLAFGLIVFAFAAGVAICAAAAFYARGWAMRNAAAAPSAPTDAAAAYRAARERATSSPVFERYK